MKRSARTAVVILLAGLAQVSLSGVVLADIFSWQFSSSVDPLTDVARGRVISSHADRGHISFSCRKGKPAAKFLVFAASGRYDVNSESKIEVAWRIDNETVHNEIWNAKSTPDGDGVLALGQNAYEFALAVGRAQKRIVFRDGNGTVVFDARGSTKAISQQLDFCGLKK